MNKWNGSDVSLNKSSMITEVDIKSGFCFGVQNAVEIAEKNLLKGEKVFCLGHIVHNDREVERLMGLGLVTINHEEFSKLSNCKVLIRAHGEPPSVYETALKNNIEIIEATCPIVKTLQSRISNAWLAMKKVNGQIVIFGKPGHAEVIGLLGHTQNHAILITDESDLKKIDPARPVWLFSQTTMSKKDYEEIAIQIKSRMEETGVADPVKDLTVSRTICGQVSDREPHLRIFARKHDVIIFVSGKESSNGKMLYNICRSENPATYFVTDRKSVV